MKYFLQTLICMSLLVLFTGCQSVFSPQVDDLLAKMRAKRDPQGKLSTITSRIVKGDFRSNTKEKGATLAVKIKDPDLIRFDIVIPGKISLIKAYDGKTAWEFSTKRGFRQLKGYEFNDLRFQASFLNPKNKPKDIFSSITIDGEEKVMGQPCIKLICKPKKKFGVHPIVMFVDKKTFLLKKRIETQGNAKFGFFKVSTIMDNYKMIDGILVPATLISYANGNIMEFEIKEIQWNKKIHNSIFTAPKILK